MDGITYSDHPAQLNSVSGGFRNEQTNLMICTTDVQAFSTLFPPLDSVPGYVLALIQYPGHGSLILTAPVLLSALQRLTLIKIGRPTLRVFLQGL